LREQGKGLDPSFGLPTRREIHEGGIRQPDATNLGGGVQGSFALEPDKRVEIAGLTFPTLSPSTDAAHIHNAAITLPYGNLEPAVASLGPINEETTTAVDPPDVPETAATEQPLALTTGNPSAAVEIAADADGDLGLRACFSRHGYCWD